MTNIAISHARAPRPRLLLLALGLVALSSCGGGQTRNPFDPSAAPAGGPDQIRVEVQNLHFNDVTVWAMRQSQRIRVGRVGGKLDQTFTIDWNTALPVSFEIDVVSGGRCRTSLVQVERNARVWVTIPSDLGLGTCRAGRRR